MTMFRCTNTSLLAVASVLGFGVPAAAHSQALDLEDYRPVADRII